MKKLIIIAPNSFKECASSVEIARLIRDGLEKYIPNSQLIVKPISDGGDGFLEVCQIYFGGNIIHYKISTPYDDLSFDCPVLYNPDNKKLYIESAEVLGLKIIPQKYRKPMYLSSKGMGELLLQINDNIDDHKIDCREIIIGIGGTGTVDMGLGMCSQLGMLFLDTNGNLVNPFPINFSKVIDIEFERISLSCNVKCVIDVTNELTGPTGAAQSFGVQKGATQTEIVTLDESYGKIVNTLKNNRLVNSSLKLFGAGGGLAAAFQIMFNSPLISSKDFILNHLGLSRYIGESDYIVTGEGAFDNQSFMGKGVGLLIEHCLKNKKEVFMICGQYFCGNELSKNLKVFELQEFFKSKAKSIAKFEEGIDKVCEKIALSLK